MNEKTLERCFIEAIRTEMGNSVDDVEDSIQNANFTAIDDNITPKVELEITSISKSSARYATSAFPNSRRGDHNVFTVLFKTCLKG